jgi:hypothetical protein
VRVGSETQPVVPKRFRRCAKSGWLTGLPARIFAAAELRIAPPTCGDIFVNLQVATHVKTH